MLLILSNPEKTKIKFINKIKHKTRTNEKAKTNGIKHTGTNLDNFFLGYTNPPFQKKNQPNKQKNKTKQNKAKQNKTKKNKKKSTKKQCMSRQHRSLMFIKKSINVN